jgi:hypothetical protein
MPVGIGCREIEGRGVARRPAHRGFHPGALWLAAAAPILATLLLVARLAA